MYTSKEKTKQIRDAMIKVKGRNSDPKFNHNSCGGCNACHQKMRIHSMTGSPVFGGSGDGEQGPNL